MLWTNWAGDQRCAPARDRAARGRGRAGRRSCARAAARGLRVRAVGAGHSFTDIACTDGAAGRPAATAAGARRRRRVRPGDASQAGITLHELGPQLAEHGLALENQGDIDAQTHRRRDCHGDARHRRALRATSPRRWSSCALVTGRRRDVVDARRERDPEALPRGARVGLGALGVRREVTLQCVPAFTLQRRRRAAPLARRARAPRRARRRQRPLRVLRLPLHAHGADAHARRAPTSRRGRAAALAARSSSERAARRTTRFGADLPHRAALPRRDAAPQPADRRGAGARRACEDHAYRVYASRRDGALHRDGVRASRARTRARRVERVLALVERRGLPILFPIEVRFAAGDDAFLSTAHGRETATSPCTSSRGMEFESYFRGVEEIMDGLGGRPHWGKRHYQTAATLRERYPRVGPLPGRARAPGPRRRVRQRLHRPRARPRRRAGGAR